MGLCASPPVHVGEIKGTRGAKLGEERDGKGLERHRLNVIRSNGHQQVQLQFILRSLDLFPRSLGAVRAALMTRSSSECVCVCERVCTCVHFHVRAGDMM